MLMMLELVIALPIYIYITIDNNLYFKKILVCVVLKLLMLLLVCFVALLQIILLLLFVYKIYNKIYFI